MWENIDDGARLLTFQAEGELARPVPSAVAITPPSASHITPSTKALPAQSFSLILFASQSSMSAQLSDPPAPASSFTSLQLDAVAPDGVQYPSFQDPTTTADFLARAREVAVLLALDVADVRYATPTHP